MIQVPLIRIRIIGNAIPVKGRSLVVGTIVRHSGDVPRVVVCASRAATGLLNGPAMGPRIAGAVH